MGTSFYFGDNLFLYHIEEVSLSYGHKEVKKKKNDILFDKASQTVLSSYEL